MRWVTSAMVVSVLQMVSGAALAAHWQLAHTICPSQLASTMEAIRALKVPLGCDLVNCCPDCKDKHPLSLEIKVQGRAAEAVRLEVAGLNKAAVDRLRVTQGAIDGPFIEVPSGKSTTVTGLPADSAAWLLLLPRLDSRLLGGIILDSDPKAPAFSMTVEQRVGALRVGRFQFDLSFKRCPLETASDNTGDRIDVQNVASGPVRSVLDYRSAPTVCVGDDARVTSGSTIFLGATPLAPDPGCPGSGVGLCCPSVALLAEDRAVYYQQITSEWPAIPGTPLVAALLPKIQVPLSVWIVEQAVTQQQAKDITDLADHIYDGEWEDILHVKGKNHGGIRFIPAFTDVPPNGLGNNVQPDCDPATIAQLKLTRFYSPDTLNVYVYNSGNQSGYCGGGIEVINLDPVDVLDYALEHEIGHALGLRHTDACTDIPHPNVMDPNVSSHGPAFTVAQNMRMHIDSESILNRLIGSSANPLRISTSTQVEKCPIQLNPWDCAIATSACPPSGLDP